MKKSNKFLILALTAILVASCEVEEFLTNEPVDSNTSISFYNTEKQINEGVISIYSQNRSINNGQWRFGEFRSDNTSFQFNPGDGGGHLTEAIDEFTMNSDNPNISDYWNDWYRGILKTNLVLNNIEDVEFRDEELKAYRKGEALFFRSWFYFNLVRSYGDIPYHTLIASDPDDAIREEFTTRQPAEEVYEKILAEAQMAIDLLPASWSGEVGRATKGAALMLKAKIHMARQQYAEAIPLLRQMETLGYSLLDNYQQIFDPANKNHKESVFEIQFSFEDGQASNFLSKFVPYNSGDDILIFNRATGRAGLNQPTQDIIDLYPESDIRASVNIAFYEGEPYVNKYNYAPLAPNQQNVNFPMFRYADARLMLAECLAQTGNFEEGIAIINNEIRPKVGS